MRRSPATLTSLALAAVVAGTAGCSGTPAGSAHPDRAATCEQVVLGIDAFNRGALDQTVAHFRTAVPIARAADDGSPAAHDLVLAVEYYAALPAEDYPEASATSPEFAHFKEVTLGQCVAGGSGDGSGDGGPDQPA